MGRSGCHHKRLSARHGLSLRSRGRIALFRNGAASEPTTLSNTTRSAVTGAGRSLGFKEMFCRLKSFLLNREYLGVGGGRGGMVQCAFKIINEDNKLARRLS